MITKRIFQSGSNLGPLPFIYLDLHSTHKYVHSIGWQNALEVKMVEKLAKKGW
jgi:hypothetical protein